MKSTPRSAFGASPKARRVRGPHGAGALNA